MIGKPNYWERSLEMIETFWFVRLGEGEMWKNVVWKWRKCHGDVEEGDGDKNFSTMEFYLLTYLLTDLLFYDIVGWRGHVQVVQLLLVPLIYSSWVYNRRMMWPSTTNKLIGLEPTSIIYRRRFTFRRRRRLHLNSTLLIRQQAPVRIRKKSHPTYLTYYSKSAAATDRAAADASLVYNCGSMIGHSSKRPRQTNAT